MRLVAIKLPGFLTSRYASKNMTTNRVLTFFTMLFFVGCIGSIYCYINPTQNTIQQNTMIGTEEAIGIGGKSLIICMGMRLIFIAKGVLSKIYWGILTFINSVNLLRDHYVVYHWQINIESFNVIELSILFIITSIMLFVSRNSKIQLFGKYKSEQ